MPNVAQQMIRDNVRDRLFEIVSEVICTHVVEEPECLWKNGAAEAVTNYVHGALERALKANELCRHGG